MENLQYPRIPRRYVRILGILFIAYLGDTKDFLPRGCGPVTSFAVGLILIDEQRGLVTFFWGGAAFFFSQPWFGWIFSLNWPDFFLHIFDGHFNGFWVWLKYFILQIGLARIFSTS